MKMNTMNISLPSAMTEFVRRCVERDYGDVSEYFRDLVREKMRRQIEADVKFLQAAMEGAPAGPSEACALQLKVRKQLRRERGV